MVSKYALLQSETSPSSSDTLTLTLIMFIPQIACAEMKISHIQRAICMILLFITIML